MILFGQLIAPDPPEWIIKDAMDRLNNNHPIMNTWGDDYANRMLYHPTGEFRSSNNKVIYLSKESHAWAQENVSKEIVDIRVFSSTVGRVMTGPHTDMTRKYTLIYLLQSGGPNHKSVYYKEKDSNDIEYPGRYSVNHFDRLEQLCQIQAPMHTWILLNSHVLHSVENIEDGRISLQINFNKIPDDVKLKNVISISDYK